MFHNLVNGDTEGSFLYATTRGHSWKMFPVYSFYYKLCKWFDKAVQTYLFKAEQQTNQFVVIIR